MSSNGNFNDDSETFGLIGRDAKLQQIREIIRTAAPSDASVLIEGESGTGKQLIAMAVHARSRRASGPLIRVNCGEPSVAELFAKHGLMEAANAGTLLLDEIAEMPAHMQIKLFRVLQERKLCGLDDEIDTDVNFRLVVTTNRDTTALLQNGVLKKDLYFCISTIKIRVPALRERLDDIPLLARHFLERFSTQYDKKIRRISQETLYRLLRYDWPGNVRELESVIERAVLFCSGNELLPECLPEELQGKDLRNIHIVIPPLVPMDEIEREAILQTLARTSGNVRRSAQILRYPRPTFYRKLKKFGIKVERHGPGSQLDRVSAKGARYESQGQARSASPLVTEKEAPQP
jgi:two-component system, NtrC family, response regulator HydG